MVNTNSHYLTTWAESESNSEYKLFRSKYPVFHYTCAVAWNFWKVSQFPDKCFNDWWAYISSIHAQVWLRSAREKSKLQNYSNFQRRKNILFKGIANAYVFRMNNHTLIIIVPVEAGITSFFISELFFVAFIVHMLFISLLPWAFSTECRSKTISHKYHFWNCLTWNYSELIVSQRRDWMYNMHTMTYQ